MLLKNVRDKLVAKLNNTDTRNSVLKTKGTDKSDSEKESSDAEKKSLILADLSRQQTIMLKLLK